MSSGTYLYTDEDLSRLVNRTKEVVIGFLANEGHITLSGQKEYEELCASYAVVIARRGMFGHFWDKVRGIDSDGFIITIMPSEIPRPGKDADVLHLVTDD